MVTGMSSTYNRNEINRTYSYSGTHTTPTSGSKGSAGNQSLQSTVSEPSAFSFESINSKSQSASVTITSVSGDSVSLSIESLEFQKALISGNASLSDEDWKKVISMVKDAYEKQKEALINSLQPQHDSPGKKTTVESGEKTDSNQIKGLPEYWNAENTSSRIVDFALSFFNASGMTSKEFLDKIRPAIEDGFKQAMDLLGKLPDAVNSLAQDTYVKTMEKLDQWEKENSDSPDVDSSQQ
ncbi:MAG: DUF5610 domain-containing protein [Chitinivibrionales bacterium]|nr:DUF5610 domain-containing protein [Chitinivibrionales bacterium]